MKLEDPVYQSPLYHDTVSSYGDATFTDVDEAWLDEVQEALWTSDEGYYIDLEEMEIIFLHTILRLQKYSIAKAVMIIHRYVCRYKFPKVMVELGGKYDPISRGNYTKVSRVD